MTSCGKIKYGVGTIDVDGNHYSTIIIGKQEWTATNLNTSKFLNGDEIFEAKTAREWEMAGISKKPAWCYYDNDTNNKEKDGKLYNWYAVNDPRGIAPKGWRIPKSDDFMELSQFLSSNGKSGTLLKSKRDWIKVHYHPNNNGTDTYGFNGTPVGTRGCTGKFIWKGEWANFHTISEHDYSKDNPMHSFHGATGNDDITYYQLSNGTDYLEKERGLKSAGSSIRLIKNNH
jgi:uncharacterized protein (TIGR02145 family)